MNVDRTLMIGVLSLVAWNPICLMAEEKGQQQNFMQKVDQKEEDFKDFPKVRGEHVKRFQKVTLNLNLLLRPEPPQEVTLSLQPFDDVSLTLRVKPARKPSAESSAWTGSVITEENKTHGHVSMIVRKRDVETKDDTTAEFEVFAKIQTGMGQVFHIDPLSGTNFYVVSEIDLEKLPIDKKVGVERVFNIPPPPPLPAEAVSSRLPSEEAVEEEAVEEEATCPVRIDLLLVYTAQARLDAGSASQIEGDIDLAVLEANQALTSSQVNAFFYVVHKTEVADAEKSDLGGTLQGLTFKHDGYMDSVHSLRNQHKADLVSLIVKQAGAPAGLANPMTHGFNTHWFESEAFSVVRYGYMRSRLSLPHELGHNMGGLHMPDPAYTPLFPYSYGHPFTVPPRLYCTIMATSGVRICCFSNPAVTEPSLGVALGDSAANIAETFRATVPIVSAFR